MAETFTFGLDLSHHQGTFDFVRAAREGIAFVILKATEGNGFIDSRFTANLVAARRAGLIVAAYHYQRNGITAAAQVAHIARVVPKGVPVIPDVEANSGSIALTRDIVSRLRAAGYRVPLSYIPRWYWQQIGSPSLSGLPPLWSSRYPDNVVGSIADEFADVPARFWDGYGGLSVALLQFTSSAAIAGRSPIDANAFRGTRAQLAAMLGDEEAEEEEDMDQTQDGRLYGVWAAMFEGSHDEAGQYPPIVRSLAQLPALAAQLKAIQGALTATEARIVGAIQADAGDQVNVGELADALAGHLDAELVAALAAELDRRARDGDPATGPQS